MKNNLQKPCLYFATIAILWLLLPNLAAAQQAPRVLQLSGLVTTGDSATGVAGAAVFVPNTTRGTYTNAQGYFSMPVLAGDSVVVSMLGYGRQYILVPAFAQNFSYATTVTLQETATELPTVDVMPWATLHDLKQAIAKVKLPEEAKPEVDLGPLQYRSVLHGPTMDAGANADYGIRQQMRGQQMRYMVPSDVKLLSIPIR